MAERKMVENKDANRKGDRKERRRKASLTQKEIKMHFRRELR